MSDDDPVINATAINRAPFNALVDDDGSGTKGSPWNKSAIQSVILDPVDAALAAAAGPLAPIICANKRGVTTLPTVENVGVATITGTIGEFDVIEAEIELHTFPGQLQPIRLFMTNSSSGRAYELARVDLLSSGLNQIMGIVVRIRAAASGPPSVTTKVWGANTTNPGSVAFTQVSLTAPDTFVTPWLLFLQHPGIPAGDTLLWAWTVTRYPKGAALGLGE